MRAPWLIVATVCLGAFMGQLDASIVTVAIPAMRSDLHASIDEVEWGALVYLLVLVGTIAAASLACAVASNIEWLLLARVFQAIGAAMLQANSVALIRTNVPNTSLGRAIGLQGAAQAIGLALGPSVGGLLVGLGGWRWVFFVNIPAGILGVGLAWFLLPRTKVKARRTRLDWWGLITLLPGIGLLLWTLSAASRGQALNPSTGIALVAGVLLLAAFVWIEHHVANPLVDLDLFRSPAFSRGILTGLLCYLVLFGVLFVFPLYLVEGLALTAAAAGPVLTVLPAALAIAAFAPLPLWALGVVLLIIGIGLGLFTPANNATVAAAGPAHHAGMVSAVLNMTRGFGTSLGVAAAAYTLGSTASHSDSQSGFHIAVTVLAIIAAVAALVCLTQLPRRTRRA